MGLRDLLHISSAICVHARAEGDATVKDFVSPSGVSVVKSSPKQAYRMGTDPIVERLYFGDDRHSKECRKGTTRHKYHPGCTPSTVEFERFLCVH